MSPLLSKLRVRFPGLTFTAGRQFCWSPETREVFYKSNQEPGARSQERDQTAVWSLLHETGHALLGHTGYQADVELLRLEVAAWERARTLAAEFGVVIDDDHIQDCLDTYRDWLHQRSICPTCRTKGLQQDDYRHYHCFNCHTAWRVSSSRFCRIYRTTKNVAQPAAVFNLFDQ